MKNINEEIASISRSEFLKRLGINESEFPAPGRKTSLEKKALGSGFAQAVHDWKKEHWSWTGDLQTAYIARSSAGDILEVAAGSVYSHFGDEGGSFDGLGFWASYDDKTDTVSNIRPVTRIPGLFAQRGVYECSVVGKYENGSGERPVMACAQNDAFRLLSDAIRQLRLGNHYPFEEMGEAVERSVHSGQRTTFSYDQLKP